MGKKVEIKFNEIEYVIQYSNYTNLLKEKKYELKLKNRQDVHEKLLKIENKESTERLKVELIDNEVKTTVEETSEKVLLD